MSKNTYKAVNITNEELMEMYWEREMTPYQMGLALGYSVGGAKTGIWQLFKRRGLKLRTRGESARLAHKLHPTSYHPPVGEKHWKWNGGRQVRDGYVSLLRPQHPRANNFGYVLEHILVWEEFNNRTVPDGWIIHHLNGIRDDNRPENLMAVSRSNHEHQTFVKTLQARIRELEQLHFRI
uniref:Putative homing endonuclease n=1 Tax=viral metagenome TaxID=1070528 RepID=A0A6H2A3B5_9ZZZZ